MTRETVITLFGHDDTITEDVRVRYVLESRDGFFEPLWFVITECKVLDTITIEPSDLKGDIENGIQFNEGFVKTVFKMDCEIEHTITAETVRA